MPRGLAGVQARWRRFTGDMAADARKAGGAAGGQLGQGMAASTPRGLSAVHTRVEAFWARLRAGSRKAGEDAGEHTSRGLTARLTGGLSRGVGGLGRVIGGAGSALGTVVAGGAAVLAGLGVAGAAALTAVGAAGAVLGTQVAAGNEQAQISFETMLGSAGKADRFLRDLQKFAASTPFEFPELQTAASSLISAGVNADKVIPIMRTLGDVTSGMGTGSEGVRRATVALQQMQAAGRITAEDLNQLRDAGIPVYDLLAKATGKSKEEVVKLASAGKLGKKELGQMMEALESGKGLERFSGLMAKQSSSLVGMWSTLKDTIGQGLAGIMQNALPIMKDGLGAISSLASQVFGWFRKNQGSIGRIFDVGRAALATFGRIASAVFGAFIKSTGDGSRSIKDLATFLEDNQAEITSVFFVLARASLQAADAAALMTSGILRGLAWVVEKTSTVQGAFYDMFGGILEAAAKAFSWIPGLGPKLATASQAFKLMGKESANSGKAVADGMRGAANGIDTTLRPAIRAGQKELDRIGRTEILKAQLRESISAASRAIKDVGTSASGSQIRLKKFSDVTKLSATEQKGLHSRLQAARQGLLDQRAAGIKAGETQEQLTRRWEKGREALYREFRQMGLSKKEAQALTEKYARIPKKADTRISQPGMPKSKADATDLTNRTKRIPGAARTTVTQPGMQKARVESRDLDNRINALNNKAIKVSVTYSASGGIRLGSDGKPGKVAGKDTGGGVTRAGGGELPGYAPNDRADNVVYRGTPGEWVISRFQSRRYGPKIMNAIKDGRVPRAVLQSYAGGGEVRRSITTQVVSNKPTNPDSVYDAAVAYARAVGDTMARSTARKLAAAYIKQAQAAAASAGLGAVDTGPAGAALGTGMRGVMAAGRRFGLGSGGSYPGHHPSQARARDFMTNSKAKHDQFSNHLWANRKKYGLWYIVSWGRIRSMTREAAGWTRYSAPGQGPHKDHVHAAVYWKGTNAARRGWGVVGDRGAELVLGPQMRWFNGGEKVLPNKETQKVLGGLGAQQAPRIGTVNLTTSDRARDAIADLVYALRVEELGGVSVGA